MDTLAYNALSDAGGATSHATSANPLDSDDDLYVEGSLEVDGTLFLDNASAVSSTGAFVFGGGTILAYNSITDAGGAASRTDVIGSDDDLFIEGSLETDGLAYFDAAFIANGS